MIDSSAKTLSFPWQDTASYTIKKVQDLVDIWSVAFDEEDFECLFVKLPTRPLFHPSDEKPVNQLQLTSTLWLFPHACVTPMTLLWSLTSLQKVVTFGGSTSEPWPQYGRMTPDVRFESEFCSIDVLEMSSVFRECCFAFTTSRLRLSTDFTFNYSKYFFKLI